MSLTSLLKSNQDLRKKIPNLKAELTDLSGTVLEKSSWKLPILVPSIGKAHEAGTIGTAFDYVARVLLTRRLGTDNVSSKELVAVQGAHSLLPKLLYQGEQSLMFETDPCIRKERGEGLKLAQEHIDEAMEYILSRLEQTLQAIEQFEAGELDVERLAPHTVFMARLDAVFRSGSIVAIDAFLQHKFGKSYFSQKLTVSDDDLTKNVICLAGVFDQHYKDVLMTHASLNPVFMPYSGAVGGADADFIFDSTLIDIKTTNKLAYSTEDWAQVLGYAAMALATGIEIERVGIYFARFGVSACFNLSPNAKEFLFEYLKEILGAAGHNENDILEMREMGLPNHLREVELPDVQ